ncbi:MAG: flavodoxin domain-containing protein [Kosmotogaceae bacterium]
MKTLMVYTSKTGTTEKCAKKLSKLLKNDVKLVDLKNAEKESIDNYDAIILGGYIHAGKAPSKLKKYIKKHPELTKKKLGIFLCFADVSEKLDEYLAKNFDEEFLKNCDVKGHFGGEFHFDKMNFMIRKIIKKMSEGHPEPKVKEENIEKFAREFTAEEA